MDKQSSKKKKSSRFSKSFIVIGLFAIIISVGYIFIGSGKNNPTNITFPKDTTENINEEFIKAVIPVVDSSEDYVLISDEKDLSIALDGNAGASSKRIFSGRRINIAVTGVDSRLGGHTKHADANHIISLLIDSGKVEIYSIPRDTYADCGYDDTTGLNKLTVFRAGNSREAYLKELARISRLDKIHYFVEFGFSQAMGLIEFLGYSESQNTLQVLRSRKGLGGDDYQRVYNQAQFMKQSIIRQFSRFDGNIGSLLLRGVLALVETNLTTDIASDLHSKMKAKGFPSSPSDVAIFIRPPMPIKFKVYDFTDLETLAALQKKIEGFHKYQLDSGHDEPSKHASPERVLEKAIAKAAADTLKNPTRAINTLSIYFEQRAWFQIKDVNQRNRIRDDIANILAHSFKKKKQFDESAKVLSIVESEKAALNHKIENKQ